jgi:hypothetical protein
MLTKTSFQWIDSGGGPLLLLEEHLLGYWKGFNFSKQHPDFVTDYDFACEIDDYLGVIEVGPGYGLVLGGEPMSTAWLPFSDTKNGLLIRWMFAENENAVTNAVNDLQSVTWQKTGIEIDFSGDRLILFDSACAGSQVGEKLEIKISEGRYSAETAHHQPNKETSLILHRFSLLNIK